MLDLQNFILQKISKILDEENIESFKLLKLEDQILSLKVLAYISKDLEMVSSLEKLENYYKFQRI